MGADVQWEGITQTVTATKGDTMIKLVIGSDVAYKNGQPVKLDVPAKIVNKRTLVPLRFVSQSMGAFVGWDPTTQQIRIFKNTPEIRTVARVIDGDTVELKGAEKVRFIGVDCPESTTSVEPFGKEASNFTKNLLEGKKVFLVYDAGKTDKYGRTLAYVFTETGVFVNAKLVADGYANIMTIAPNVKYQDVFLKIEQQARDAKKGLWSLTGSTTTGSTGTINQGVTSGKYVGSKESNKYHVPSCRWAERILPVNKIWFKDIAGARAHNYEPCGVCKPPAN